MSLRQGLIACVMSLLLAPLARAADEPPPAPRVLIEIYRIAPGLHEQFMRMIAQADDKAHATSSSA